MDFQLITDSLNALESGFSGLQSADALKASNDAKFAAAQDAKGNSDKADVDAATSVNSALDAFGTLVAEFVAKSKVTR